MQQWPFDLVGKSEVFQNQKNGLKLWISAVFRESYLTSSAAVYLWPKIRGGANVLVLSFGSAPGMVQFEALVAIASLAVHAALCCLLLVWRFADVAHYCNGSAGGLPVALNDALQGEVAEQHTDATLTQVNVVLATRAWDGRDPGSHRPSTPARGWDGTWRNAKRYALDKGHV